MNPPEHGLIGFKTAMILFAVLTVTAVATLRGTALALTLIILLALAAKAYVHHLRRRME